MGETSAATKAPRKRDGINGRLMLRFQPEARVGIEAVQDECGIDSLAAACRFLIYEALKARGYDRAKLREMLAAKELPAQAAGEKATV